MIINGNSQVLTQFASGPTGAGSFGNHPFYLMCRDGSSFFYSGNIYSLIMRGAATDPDGMTNGNAYTASKTGVTL